MLNVGMVLFPRLAQLDLTGPYEALGRLPDARSTLVAAWLEPVRGDRGLTSTRAESARYLTPVCTGALWLGEAGLLRNYRASGRSREWR
jgi:cyclohexyl-isocyanide hydratase